MHRVAIPVVSLALIALACDAPPAQTLRAVDVVGCYALTDSAGLSVPAASAFSLAPVQLDTVQSPKRFAWASNETRWYVVKPTIPLAPEQEEFDTIMNRAMWSIVAPDTLVIVRTNGFVALNVRLHRDTAMRFVGSVVVSSDAMDPDDPPVPRPVRARRVACPTG